MKVVGSTTSGTEGEDEHPDRAEFLALYETYHGALCRFARRFVGSRASAEDVVHEVFLRLWMRRVAWQGDRSLHNYLYAAVRNEAIVHLRRGEAEARAVGSTVREEDAGTPYGGVEREVQVAELAAALQRAVDELPPRPREVLLLKWQRQMTNAEIGAELGLALKTVEMHITRALDGLRRRVEGLRGHR